MRMRAGGGLAQPGQALGQLALPVAGDARQADNFAAADLQIDAAQRFSAAVAHGLQALGSADALRRHCMRLGASGFTSRPTIILTSSSRVHLRRSARADHPAIAQHGHPVADRHDFVQLMGDEDQRVAFPHHALEGGKQVVDFLRGQAPRSARPG